jgi:hypothetical protein
MSGNGFRNLVFSFSVNVLDNLIFESHHERPGIEVECHNVLFFPIKEMVTSAAPRLRKPIFDNYEGVHN